MTLAFGRVNTNDMLKGEGSDRDVAGYLHVGSKVCLPLLSVGR